MSHPGLRFHENERRPEFYERRYELLSAVDRLLAQATEQLSIEQAIEPCPCRPSSEPACEAEWEHEAVTVLKDRAPISPPSERVPLSA